MNKIIRNNKSYSNTTLQVPYDLKMEARQRGINLSRTLVDALTEKLQGTE